MRVRGGGSHCTRWGRAGLGVGPVCSPARADCPTARHRSWMSARAPRSRGGLCVCVRPPGAFSTPILCACPRAHLRTCALWVWARVPPCGGRAHGRGGPARLRPRQAPALRTLSVCRMGGTVPAAGKKGEDCSRKGRGVRPEACRAGALPGTSAAGVPVRVAMAGCCGRTSRLPPLGRTRRL